MEDPVNTSSLEYMTNNYAGNGSMKLSMETACGPGNGNGSTPCKEEGMGINLSTPILMLSSGLMGNTLALVVLYTMKKETKQTVFFTLLAGLAWTDLIGQLMTGPIAIIVYANNLQWVGGEATCMYHAFSMICFGFLTPVLVCAMSLDRLIALKFTFFYARNFTRKKAQILVVVCWIIVLFVCSWPLMGFGSYEKQYPGSWCFLNFHKESKTDVAFATTYSVINLLLIVINFLCNIVVISTVINMRKKRIIQNSPSIDRKRRPHRSKSQKRLQSETQMVVFMCTITFVFSVCYIPFNVNIIVNQVTGVTNHRVDLMVLRLLAINQILDPWLYILLRRAQLLKILNNIKLKICYACGGGSGSFIPSKQYEYPHDKTDAEMGKSYALKSVMGEVDTQVHPIENGSDSSGSRDSLGSTSNLIQECELEPRPHRKYMRSISADNSHPLSGPSLINDSDSDVFREEMACFRTLFGSDKRKKQTPSRRLSVEHSIERTPRTKRLYSLPNNIDILRREALL
ncbi:prostaglandin E2 receptor EP4 subtype-like [Mizuhopecten yessoensis]|uniref:Thromboxane A2 receptor n=1 Tax=Mizuhopecten yessoensis TaxID=6573 RepID=A0A210PEK6_MIZYE|nr:prostaglandin E2 receptor EP4 subtype-like [Mizuhopecten yessoensis]XP_021343563.1 prostaglandin E2 receptor EP4 subtype-like [Mizuhopecten yessoensis]XP_021343564.1 prostaglandin E2 receptor EP4 subtype-like [Mizuhopecten yessoensis]XP_021343565.1 prostaglandin E2 receptor EP4 subtype-like [Mizuhopecten yessoensis]XP_021343566.1 prostaglandin E2 receptor EP4 subtype-like [Mizuhopecten yessoensis]XP_021343567.1 prostaglandin E2 receptor EP4 subtype-like [Mizuhopecten yessoensis]XP_02134356